MEHETAGAEAGDITPVLGDDPLDLRLTLVSLVHWADSREVRVGVMREIGFPTDDVLEFLVVNQITYRGALRPTDLASVLGTGKANISKIVRRLEAIGLVRRVPYEGDERSVLVALTADGRALGERILAASESLQRQALAGWSDDDVATLRRFMARFARRAVDDIAARSPGMAVRRD